MIAHDRQALLEQAKGGETRALGTLLEGFRPYVRVIVRSLRGRRVLARVDDSDVIQDALLEATRSFGDFRGTTVAEFIVWLRQIALRSAGRTLRGLDRTGKRDPGREAALDDLAALVSRSDSCPSAHAIRQEQAAQMAEALARLPEEMQQVLLLRHVDGLPHPAIAERLGRSPTAVRMLYLRALRRLREACAE